MRYYKEIQINNDKTSRLSLYDYYRAKEDQTINQQVQIEMATRTAKRCEQYIIKAIQQFKDGEITMEEMMMAMNASKNMYMNASEGLQSYEKSLIWANTCDRIRKKFEKN